MDYPIVVGLSGASAPIYGIETLKALRVVGVPTHLVMSRTAHRTIALETTYAVEEVLALADVVHDTGDMAAAVSSGSFRTRGMIVAPCSMKTLSAIANSFSDNLLARAADVTLKERRRLVLMVRETPLHRGHLELMLKVTDMGAVILPPVPAFYHRPQTIEDLVRQSVGKALDLFGIEHDLFRRWQGPQA
jgi:4-hydroxy-3-polyprenylbenzoate decarboxylase